MIRIHVALGHSAIVISFVAVDAILIRINSLSISKMLVSIAVPIVLGH